MSLDFNFTRCSTETKVAETRHRWNAIVSYLAMFTGTHEITEKNFEETFRRFDLWERAGGPLAGDVHGPVTKDTLRCFFGARWNVHLMTKRQFEARLKSYALDSLKRKAS